METVKSRVSCVLGECGFSGKTAAEIPAYQPQLRETVEVIVRNVLKDFHHE